MTKTTFAAIKEAIGNKGFLVGVVGVILIIFLSSTESMIEAFRSEELLANSFHDTMIAAALTSDGMTLALPILAALPFTASFVDDMKSGFVKEYLPRTDVKSYLVGKCTACALSGGLVLMLGVFGAYVLATLVFSPMEAALPADAEAPAISSCIESGKLFSYLFLKSSLSKILATVYLLVNSIISLKFTLESHSELYAILVLSDVYKRQHFICNFLCNCSHCKSLYQRKYCT